MAEKADRAVTPEATRTAREIATHIVAEWSTEETRAGIDPREAERLIVRIAAALEAAQHATTNETRGAAGWKDEAEFVLHWFPAPKVPIGFIAALRAYVAAALEAAGAEGQKRGTWDVHLENAVNMLNGEVARLESERDALAARVSELEAAGAEAKRWRDHYKAWDVHHLELAESYGAQRDALAARVRELEAVLRAMVGTHNRVNTRTSDLCECPECAAARAALAGAPAERAGEAG